MFTVVLAYCKDIEPANIVAFAIVCTTTFISDVIDPHMAIITHTPGITKHSTET